MNTPASIPSKKTEPPRWKRRLKAILFAVAGLITLLFLVLAVESYRGRLAWDKYRAQLEEQGEKFDVEAYRDPVVPDAENFASIPIFQETTAATSAAADRPRSGLFPWTWPQGDWTRYEVTDWSGWQREIREGSDKGQQWGLSAAAASPEVLQLRKTPLGDPLDDLFRLLNLRGEIMAQVREVAPRPYTRFDLESVFAGSLSVIHRARELTRAFQFKALAELSRGNPDAALADWQVMIRLAEAIGSEPVLIFHLVQIDLLNRALQPVWEGLAERQWTEAELIEIERTLAQVNLRADTARAYRGERIFILLRLEAGPPQPPDENASAASLKSWLSLPFIYHNKLSIARMYQDYFLIPLDPENRDFDLAQIQGSAAEAQEQFGRKTPYNMVAATVHQDLVIPSLKSLRMQTGVELARTACALERCRLARGAYPNQLEELVPEFLPQIPIDLADGKPLRYRPVQDGRFILYSIGIDGEDHGGKTRQELDKKQVWERDQEAGDWVWKYL